MLGQRQCHIHLWNGHHNIFFCTAKKFGGDLCAMDESECNSLNFVVVIFSLSRLAALSVNGFQLLAFNFRVGSLLLFLITIILWSSWIAPYAYSLIHRKCNNMHDVDTPIHYCIIIIISLLYKHFCCRGKNVS